MIGEIVARLIAAGAPPEVAATAVCEAFEMGVETGKSADYPRDETTEKRRAYDRERARTKREIRRQSAESADSPISPLSISKKEKKERERGTRLPPDWEPSSADKDAAKLEGLSENDISREGSKFRDYWLAKAGQGGVKLDWPATWRNWCRRAADYLGRQPVTENNVVPIGCYAAFGSAELDAWDAHNRKTKGINLPRDKRGGWSVPTRWPPGYEATEVNHGAGNGIKAEIHSSSATKRATPTGSGISGLASEALAGRGHDGPA